MRVPWNRGGLRSYLLLIGLLAGRATPGSIAAGMPLLFVGIGLRLWAKGYLHQQGEVTSAGPYRFVRHPFYLANALLDLALAIMSGWWVLVVLFPLWWLAIYLPTMRREEGEMAALFGEVYDDYRRRVPFLIPGRRWLPPQPAGFSWKSPTLTRTEMPRALRFLSYPLMFVLAYRVRSHGLDLLLAPSLFDALVLAGCVSLLVAGRELRRHLRQGRSVQDPSGLASA